MKSVRSIGTAVPRHWHCNILYIDKKTKQKKTAVPLKRMGQLQEEQKHAGPGLASKSKGRAIHSIGQAGGASSGHMPVKINKLK